MGYKEYTLRSLEAIHNLAENYNFPYLPSLDILSVYNTVNKMKKAKVLKYMIDKYLVNIGLIGAIKLNDYDFVVHFIESGATISRNAIKAASYTTDERIINLLV
jgi:hypothetical protein